MVDKNYCCSSYLAFRYVEKEGIDFFEGLHHVNAEIVPVGMRIGVHDENELDESFKNIFQDIIGSGKKIGIMLSGGMDSACLASYLPAGTDAYTFRFLGGEFQESELERAEYYAKTYDLNLHYVEISWDDVMKYLPDMMRNNCTPVHSIVPQIYKACMQAKEDGVEELIFGECADSTFGGLDRMVSKDWDYDEFVKWYTFLDPKDVLVEPVDVSYVYESFRLPDNKIDYIRFMQTVFAQESETSYQHIFEYAKIGYMYPYQKVAPAEPLDLQRIRNGDTKYIIRGLFRKKYPGYPVPEKNPMPRPVDVYFANWNGPTRKEFRKDIDMNKLTGNQKWQLWCLEAFLNLYDPNQEA